MIIDKEIIVEMIYDYFITKSYESGNDGEIFWRNYKIKFGSLIQSDIELSMSDKIRVAYEIKFRGDGYWAKQIVGLNKNEYIYRLNNKKALERDKKIDEILNVSIWDKLKGLI